jgi:hypothetical protein
MPTGGASSGRFSCASNIQNFLKLACQRIGERLHHQSFAPLLIFTLGVLSLGIGDAGVASRSSRIRLGIRPALGLG